MDTVEQIKSNLKEVIRLFDELQLNQSEDDNYRIIHYKNNPMELACQARLREYNKLKADNEKLRVRLQLLEAGSEADVTRRIDEAGDRSSQIIALSRKVEELQVREEKLLTSFSRMGREFREVFYLLSGLKVNALKDGIYEIANMYAESEADKLFLQLSPDGTTQLLQNEYSDKLTDYIEIYLQRADSFPAFLAALTLDLFNSTAGDNKDTDLSVDMMETTVRQRY